MLQKPKSFYLLSGILFLLCSFHGFAQTKVLLVWDEASLLQKANKKAVSLNEGMKLLFGDTIKIEEGHDVTLLLENGKKIELVGPSTYSIPNINWSNVALMKLADGSTKELAGGLLLPINATISVQPGYQVTLAHEEKNQVLKGNTEFQVSEEGYVVERFEAENGSEAKLDYSKSIKLTNLGEAVSAYRRTPRFLPIPLLPRGTVKPHAEYSFVWTKYAPGTEYVLKIWTGMDTEILKVTTKENSYQVEGSLLNPKEKYKWIVGIIENGEERGLDDDDGSYQYIEKVQFLRSRRLRKFEKLEKEALARCEKDPKKLGAWWDLLVLHYNNRLYLDALAVLHKITKGFGLRAGKVLPVVYEVCISKLKIRDPEIIAEHLGFDLVQLAKDALKQPHANLDALRHILEQDCNFSSQEVDAFNKGFSGWKKVKLNAI